MSPPETPRPRRGRGQGEGTIALAATVCLMLLALLAPTPAHAQSLDEVVNGVETTYGKIVDLRAEFAQTARNKSLGQDIKAEGIVLLKKGGKMRWDYKSPAPQQIVSDGTSLWVYTPELNQVNKGNAPKALAGPAGSFLSGLGKLREEFTVRFLVGDDAAHRRHLGDVRGDVVTRRQLDDREGEHRDRPDSEDGEDGAAADVSQHGG